MRQSEIERAIRAVRRMGLSVEAVEIEGDTLRIQTAALRPAGLEKWEAKRVQKDFTQRRSPANTPVTQRN